MIAMMIGSAVYLVAMQAAVNVPRAAFSDCLKQANAKATSEKVTPEAYPDFIRVLCTGQAATFKSALVSFDVKNGIKRAQASTDADLQIDDYIAGSTDNYQARFAATKPKAAPTPAATPAPTAASVPK
jgi:dGTP triphosphohydrolase